MLPARASHRAGFFHFTTKEFFWWQTKKSQRWLVDIFPKSRKTQNPSRLDLPIPEQST